MKPQQQRSEFTVDSIKQAALQLLGEDGAVRLSTDRIAKRAGVGIGTLYEYFPNREAILKTLYEDVSLDFVRTMQGVLPAILDLPTEQAVTRVMRKLVAMHEKHQLVLIRLVNEVPELRLATQGVSVTNLIRNTVRGYVQGRSPSLKVRDVNRKAFFIQRIILGCIQSYLTESPAGVTRQDFTRELARIIAGIIDEKSSGS